MNTRKISMALAMAAAIALTGCPNRDTGGGGGAADKANKAQDRMQGADQGRDVMAADEKKGYEDRAPMGEKVRANLTVDLTGSARDYAEAYARAPWVHANLAAGDWERADDDLQFISKQIADLQKDKKLDPSIKRKLDTIKPMISLLDGQIGAKNQQAVHNARLLVDRMGRLVDDRQVLAWFGAHPLGGGAGTGKVGPKRVGDKEVGPKIVGPKEVGPKHVGP